MGKATAKKGTRKTAAKAAAIAPTAAPVEAAAPVLPAPTPPPAPAYMTPESRQARTIETSLLEQAMRRAGASGKHGVRNLCWQRIPAGVQHDIAVAHIVDKQTADAIWNERRADMAAWSVSRSSYDRWTRDIRTAFDAEYARHHKGRSTIDHAIWKTGDLVANMGVWFSQVAPLMSAYAADRMEETPSKDELNCILRFTECTIDAAKVQAEAKHTERKTLLLAIKAANEKGLKAKSGRDREQAIRESVELVNAIIRGEVAA
jgi:hypothetical protein